MKGAMRLRVSDRYRKNLLPRLDFRNCRQTHRADCPEVGVTNGWSRTSGRTVHLWN